MTDPLDDAPIRAHERRFRIELLALLAVLLGAVLVVWGVWQLDWRAGVVTLGGLLVAGGLVLGSEGT